MARLRSWTTDSRRTRSPRVLHPWKSRGRPASVAAAVGFGCAVEVSLGIQDQISISGRPGATRRIREAAQRDQIIDGADLEDWRSGCSRGRRGFTGGVADAVEAALRVPRDTSVKEISGARGRREAVQYSQGARTGIRAEYDSSAGGAAAPRGAIKLAVF